MTYVDYLQLNDEDSMLKSNENYMFEEFVYLSTDSKCLSFLITWLFVWLYLSESVCFYPDHYFGTMLWLLIQFLTLLGEHNTLVCQVFTKTTATLKFCLKTQICLKFSQWPQNICINVTSVAIIVQH